MPHYEIQMNGRWLDVTEYIFRSWTGARRLDGARLHRSRVLPRDRNGVAMTACKCDAPGSGRFYVTSPDKRTSPGAPKGKWEMFCPACLIENGQQNAITRRLAGIKPTETDG